MRIFNKTTFVWLYAGLLGALGVDRFARGQVLIGIIKLLTVEMFGIWWCIDFVIALVKAYGASYGNSDQIVFDAAGHYVR